MQFRLTDYFRTQPLASLVAELADTKKYPESQSPGVAETILSLVQRYAMDFGESRYLAQLPGGPPPHSEEANRIFEKIRNELIRLLSFMDPPESLKGVFGSSLHCLSDARSTAALLREIIFDGTYFLPGEKYSSVDLGMGTGVLSLGAIISFLRNGAKNIVCHGVEECEVVANKAKVLLETISNVEVRVVIGDLTNSKTYDHIPPDAQLYLSETINYSTPNIRVWENGHIWSGVNYYGEVYGEVLEFLSEKIPGFVDRIIEREIGLFPDVINGTYKPNGDDGHLFLCTATDPKFTRLKEIEEEFKQFEVLTCGQRWSK